jgi:hypothetical protein
MSPKVLRQNGVRVDKNNKPTQQDIMQLKQEIAACKDATEKSQGAFTAVVIREFKSINKSSW